jgi:hypothetical protein
MQEEIENRSVTLVIATSKLTARVLRDAMRRCLETKKYQNRTLSTKDTVKHGKQTLKQLVGQGKGVTNIEVTDSNIGSFEGVASKYGVDFAVKKDTSQHPSKYLVFFKAPDTDAMTAAFKEFTAKAVKRKEKPSILEKLQGFREIINQSLHSKTKTRKQEHSL